MAAELNLLPCPFCGQHDGAQHLPTCWFMLRDLGASRARLAQAWNRRAAPSSSADELPPLPDARAIRAGHAFPKVYALGYTADMMQEYARSAIAADRRASQGEPVGEVLDGYTGDSRAARIYRGQEFKTGDKLYRAATKAAAPADARIEALARKLVEFYPDTLPNMFCDGQPVGRELVHACRASAEDAREQQPAIQAVPLQAYQTEDRAFFRFWYSHMQGDVMTGALADISHSTARYVWDAATRCRAEGGDGAPEAGDVSADRAQQGEPVACAISYWMGPTIDGVPLEDCASPLGWSEYKPSLLQHGEAITERGDKDKRVKWLYDRATKAPAPAGVPTEQDRLALELANAALIAAQPRDIGPKGWERHEAAINATSCALHKPKGAAPVPDTGIPTAGEVEDLKLKLRALVYAASAVIERWESPKWKDEAPTADYIARLREAVNVASSNSRAPVSSTPTSGAVEKATPYTCIGKGGRYLLLGTATGAGTSRDLEDLRIYIDAENPLEMYYRTVPNFDLRMARMDDATPSHPSEAQAGEDA